MCPPHDGAVCHGTDAQGLRTRAPADQHKFGPLAPLPDNTKRLKDRLLKVSGR